MYEIVLTSICLAFILVEVIQIKKYFGNKKPINCGMCLSGWIALADCLLTGHNILYTFVAMVSYIFMEKILHKL